MVVALVVAVGGFSALAYFGGWFGRTPPKAAAPAPLSDQEILYRAFSALPDIQSGAIRFDLGFTTEPREADAKPLSLQVPQLQDQQAAIRRDRERLDEVRTAMAQLESRASAWRSSRAAGATVTEPPYPLNLAEAVLDADGRTDPGGAPYAYVSDGQGFTLSFRLETATAVTAWNKQLDGSRQYGAGKLAPPRAAVGQEVTLTEQQEPPYVFLSRGESPLGMLAESREFYQVLPNDVAASFSIWGEFAADPTPEETGDASMGMGGKLTMGGMSFSAAGELRKVGEQFYGLVKEFPSLGFFDLHAIKGKWVLMTAEDLVGSDLDFDFSVSQAERDEEEAKVKHYRLFLTVAREQELFTIAQALPPAEGSHRYRLRFNWRKFPEFYRAYVQRAQAELPGTKVKLDQEVIEFFENQEYAALYDALSQDTTVEVWVQAGTFLPHKFSAALRIVPPDEAAKFAGKQLKLTAALTLEKINQPVSIAAPSPTISFDEATGLITGQPPSVVAFQRQLRNVEAIRTALGRYQARAGQYPQALEELKRKPSEVPLGTSPSAPAEPREGIIRHGSPIGGPVIPSDDAAPFLKVIPNDVYTKLPYPYQREGDAYTLRYQMKLPPKGERTATASLGRWGYDDVVEGENTADLNTISREASGQQDSDGDGLSDWQERATYGTDPSHADTDQDGFSDGVEVKNGYNPNGPGRLQPVPSASPKPASLEPSGFQPRAYDSQRVADIKQLQTALELYFSDQNSYPVAARSLNLGQDVACLDSRGLGTGCPSGSGNIIYMGRIPTDPAGWDYLYTAIPAARGQGSITQYCIEFTLYRDTGGLVAGKNYASESGTSSTCVH